MPVNTMPTLALSYQVALEGIYPSQPGGGGSGEWYLGAIRTFAGNFQVRGHAFAQGQTLSIAQNTALFSLYGTTYGGNGQTTFALPNFAGDVYRGVGQLPGGQNYTLGLENGNDTVSILQTNLPGAAGGSSQAVSNIETSLTARYCINVNGGFATPNSGGTAVDIIGAITQFAGGFAPAGTVECNGQLLSIAQNSALFQLIGTTYGGDGQTTFAVPDLRGRTPVGVGQGPGLSNAQLGQSGGSETIVLTNANLPVEMGGQGTPVDNHSPYLVLTPLIAVQGVFPSRDAPISIPGEDGSPIEFQPDISTIGEILWFAGNFAPPGWAIAQGQILSIAQNTALFSILGTTYGGNGQTTFALPDLRGRAITGFGGNENVQLGQQSGTETITLTMSDIPALTINGSGADETYYGSNQADFMQGNGGADQLNGNGGDDDLRGGAGNDTLNGGNGNDRLNGGTGTDTLNGGAGNDIYIIDDVGDVLTEGPGGGLDSVFTSVGWTLAAEFERLGVSDFATTNAINLTGNGVANEMWGNAGANVLDGAGGADLMYGFGGDDTYHVDNAGDIVIELTNEGTDTVLTTVSYTIAHDIEKLAVSDPASTGAINLTGNELANEITGNAGANVIDGGLGGDSMSGLGGNDIYIVDNAGDAIVEGSGGGLDTVFTSVSFTLGSEVERLGVNGFYTTYAIDLTGNALANEMWGNDGANVLDGKAGSDIIRGFGGADTFAFTTALGPNNVDQLVDFTAGIDKIALDDAVFTGLATGALAAGAFRVGAAAQDADDRIIYDNLTGKLYFDADGNGSGAAVQFAVVHEGMNLTASDFTVI